MILLLLAPNANDRPHWQRRDGARIIAQGSGLPPADPSVPLIVAVPGEAVALHWLDLPELAPAQAAAAARLMLGDSLAEADPHIAVAAGAGLRPVAVVARAAMAGWLAELASAGLTPAALVPEPLLLPAPAAGFAVLETGERIVARSANAGFAAEADLAAALMGDAPTTAAMFTPTDPLPLNLLSGDYAPVSRWQPPPGLARRLGLLAATLAGLWLAGDVAAWVAARRAASAAMAETQAVAGTLLPAGADDPLAALTALARQRGADGGLGALAGPVVEAIAARPGAALASLRYTPPGGLVAGVAGGAGEAQALAETLSAQGLAASAGQTRATADGSDTPVMVKR
jgi:general secretion pathway protein L